jgi:hypothetical protein
MQRKPFKAWEALAPQEQQAALRARREKLEAARSKLAAGIEAMVKSGRWREYLAFSSRFHHYSFGNTLLIMLQKPDATQVASYRTWERLGRHVQKGARGISIFVPLLARRRPGDDPPAQEETKQNGAGRELETGRQNPDLLTGTTRECLVGFKIGTVFDVSQTDGAALPRHPAVILEGDDGGMSAALDAFAREVLTIEIEQAGSLTIPGANGECLYGPDGKAERIRILASNPPLQQAKTRAHELGHALLHGARQYRGHQQRSIQELEAESVSFSVLDYFGIDSGAYSFGYLAEWGGGEDAVRTISGCGERIRKAADQIITWIEAHPPLQREAGIPDLLPAVEEQAEHPAG